jgi:hypothetical protein
MIEKHCAVPGVREAAQAAAREIADAAAQAAGEERARVDGLALHYLTGLGRACYIAERDGHLTRGRDGLTPTEAAESREKESSCEGEARVAK